MLTRRTVLAGGAVAAPSLAWLGSTRPAQASAPPVFQHAGLAIRGMDPVAYFALNGPVRGREAYQEDWNGAVWRFASAANRDVFVADPVRYAPVFGGYCAYAASRGSLASTVSNAWSVYEGRLFLNASLRAREFWTDRLPNSVAAGEANWPAILG